MSAKFERRFGGRDNAGLRKRIRDTTSGAYCGPKNERNVLALADVVALTQAGRETLCRVAADYRDARPDYNPRCDCDACLAGGLQGLGAFG